MPVTNLNLGPKFTTFLILVFLILIDSGRFQSSDQIFDKTKSKQLDTNKFENCKNISTQKLMNSDDVMLSYSNANDIFLKNVIESVFGLVNNKEFKIIFKSEMRVLLIILILLIWAIVSFLFFLINSCICCSSGRKANTFCVLCNFWMYFICLIGFLLSLGAFTYFSLQAEGNFNQSFCKLSMLNADLINGSKAPQKFLGIFPLKTLLQNFKKEFDIVSNNHKNFFQDIQGLKLKTSSERAIAFLNDFCQNCKDEKTTNAKGQKKTPNSVSQDFDHLTSAAKKEFAIVHDFVLEIETGVESSLSLIDDNDTVQNTLSEVDISMNDMILKIQNGLDLSMGYFGTVHDNFFTFQIIYISLCGLLFVTGIIIFILLAKAFQRKKAKYFCCLRIILLIFGLAFLALSAFCLMLGIGFYLGSASCETLLNIKSEEGVDYVSPFLSLDTKEQDFLKLCTTSTGSGSLIELIQIFDVDSKSQKDLLTKIDDLIYLFKIYNLKNLKINSRPESEAFIKYSETLKKYESGNGEDHSYIKSTLTDLNNEVKCAGLNYILNEEKCPSQNRCESLKTLSPLEPPSCVDSQKKQEVQEMMKNLHAYINETEVLVQSLLQQTYNLDENASTPHKSFVHLLSDLEIMESKLDIVEPDLKFTLQNLDFSSIFEENNCKMLQEELQVFEALFCRKFIPEYFYLILSVIIALGFFCSLLFSFFCLVCTLENSEINNDNGYENPNDDKECNENGIEMKNNFDGNQNYGKYQANAPHEEEEKSKCLNWF